MNLYKILVDQIKKEPNYITDNGDLKKWVVLNKAQDLDEELIGLLLDNADLKEKFFVNVKGTLVFNQNLFVQFLEQKNYKNGAGIDKDVSLKNLRKTYITWVNQALGNETGLITSHSTQEVLERHYIDPKVLSAIERGALEIKVFG